MEKELWIQQWIITCTASYAALNYDENSYNCWRDKEAFIHPQDVYYMAEIAYERYLVANKDLSWEELKAIGK